MGNINDIRELLERFEHNITDEKGHNYLSEALEYIREVLDESNNERERKVAKNLMKTYCNEVLEKVRGWIFDGTPDSERLHQIHNLLTVFKDFSFDDDPNFQDIEREVFSRLFVQCCIELRGRQPKDFTTLDKVWFSENILAENS